jgi:hypothetical protein
MGAAEHENMPYYSAKCKLEPETLRVFGFVLAAGLVLPDTGRWFWRGG